MEGDVYHYFCYCDVDIENIGNDLWQSNERDTFDLFDGCDADDVDTGPNNCVGELFSFSNSCDASFCKLD